MEDGSWYVMNLYGEDDLLRDDLPGVSTCSETTTSTGSFVLNAGKLSCFYGFYYIYKTVNTCSGLLQKN